MVARTLYFDESGFTGDNLLDGTQPIFAIASTDLEPEVAEVAVLTKIVDFLIEPLFSTTGYDFYADGFSLKYTNYIHFGLTQFAEGFTPLIVAALRRSLFFKTSSHRGDVLALMLPTG